MYDDRKSPLQQTENGATQKRRLKHTIQERPNQSDQGGELLPTKNSRETGKSNVAEQRRRGEGWKSKRGNGNSH